MDRLRMARCPGDVRYNERMIRMPLTMTNQEYTMFQNWAAAASSHVLSGSPSPSMATPTKMVVNRLAIAAVLQITIVAPRFIASLRSVTPLAVMAMEMRTRRERAGGGGGEVCSLGQAGVEPSQGCGGSEGVIDGDGNAGAPGLPPLSVIEARGQGPGESRGGRRGGGGWDVGGLDVRV